MDKEKIKDAKLMALATNKIKEFCQHMENCEICPAHLDHSADLCYFSEIAPNKWDLDALLYRIAYFEGKGETNG